MKLSGSNSGKDKTVGLTMTVENKIIPYLMGDRNYFIKVGLDGNGELYVTVHSGSRLSD